jgi:hypothetical protein
MEPRTRDNILKHIEPTVKDTEFLKHPINRTTLGCIVKMLVLKCQKLKLVTSLCISMEKSTYWEADSHQLDKKFQAFFGTRKLISVLTRDLHWSLRWAKHMHSISSQLLPSEYILILSSFYVYFFQVFSYLTIFSIKVLNLGLER